MQKLHDLFASMFHRSAMNFQTFDMSHWTTFFHVLHPSFKISSPADFHSELIRGKHSLIMTKSMKRIVDWKLACFSSDQTTNILHKQCINLMTYDNMSDLLEHFQIELKRKIFDNLMKKLVDIKMCFCQWFPLLQRVINYGTTRSRTITWFWLQIANMNQSSTSHQKLLVSNFFQVHIDNKLFKCHDFFATQNCR